MTIVQRQTPHTGGRGAGSSSGGQRPRSAAEGRQNGRKGTGKSREEGRRSLLGRPREGREKPDTAARAQPSTREGRRLRPRRPPPCWVGLSPSAAGRGRGGRGAEGRRADSGAGLAAVSGGPRRSLQPALRPPLVANPTSASHPPPLRAAVRGDEGPSK